MYKSLVLFSFVFIFQINGFTQNSSRKSLPTYADSVNAGLILEDNKKGSVPRATTLKLGKTTLTLNYYSPGLRGRVIWGGLVPFDQVWVTGAHSANKFEISTDIKINGKTIKAGTYGLFTIPGKEKWTFILNTRSEQHLSDDYNQKEDVFRLEVAPRVSELTQRLTFEIKPTSKKQGQLLFHWEKLSFSVPFSTL